MARFDFGAAVDTMTYDFTTGSAGWDEANGPGKGVIPEPSRKHIIAFQSATAAALGLPPGAGQQQVTDALAGMDAETAERVADALLDALSALCQGSPSRKELETLGVRGLNAFSGFIHGQLSEANPT